MFPMGKEAGESLELTKNLSEEACETKLSIIVGTAADPTSSQTVWRLEISQGHSVCTNVILLFRS